MVTGSTTGYTRAMVDINLREAKNYRQVFAKSGSIYLGIPLSFVQQLVPSRVGAEPDHKGMRPGKMDCQYTGGIDRLTAVSLSGTTHREDEPSHITFVDNMDRTVKDILGFPTQIITGYKGTADVLIAMESGELAGGPPSWDNVKVNRKRQLEEGSMVVVMQGTNELADL
jgi:hypothetical protein